MVAAVSQALPAGALSGSVIHEKVIDELVKVKRVQTQIGNPSIAINRLPDKNQRKTLQVQAGSVLNISGKDSELVEIAKQLKAAVKSAGKALTGNTKKVFEAKAQFLEALGGIEVDIASGKYSVDDAFKRSGRIDKLIKATIQIAEYGGLEDKNIALENIKALKEFQDVPSVALALGKHAPKIAKIESETSNQALLPFIAASSKAQGLQGFETAKKPPEQQQEKKKAA